MRNLDQLNKLQRDTNIDADYNPAKGRPTCSQNFRISKYVISDAVQTNDEICIVVFRYKRYCLIQAFPAKIHLVNGMHKSQNHLNEKHGENKCRYIYTLFIRKSNDANARVTGQSIRTMQG